MRGAYYYTIVRGIAAALDKTCPAYGRSVWQSNLTYPHFAHYMHYIQPFSVCYFCYNCFKLLYKYCFMFYLSRFNLIYVVQFMFAYQMLLYVVCAHVYELMFKILLTILLAF